MAKLNPTQATASKTIKTSKSGVHHGPNVKNVVRGGKRVSAPSGPAVLIKGRDRGGV